MKMTDKNVNELLHGISVIEFSGESCANCLSLMPILHELTSKMEGVNLHHVEVDENAKELVSKFEIFSVPTIIVMNDDKEIARCRGFQPEEILELWLDAKVSEIKNNK